MTPMEGFNVVAGLFSIGGGLVGVVSLLISIAVLKGVKKIRQHYAFLLQSPALTGRLKRHTKSLNALLNTFDESQHDIVTELRRTRVTLTSISEHDTIKDIVELASARQSLDGLLSTAALSRDGVWQVFECLTLLEERLTDKVNTMMWSGPNG